MKKLTGNLYKAGETATNYTDNEYESVAPGAYVGVITHVLDTVDKEYLYVEIDIAEGEHKGYFKRLSDSFNFWGCFARLSYKEGKAQKSFGGVCRAINASNAPYMFNPFDDGANTDEKTLIGKKVGIILREEEYENKNGEVKTSIRTDKFGNGLISTERAKNADYLSSKAFARKIEKVCLDNVPKVATASNAFMSVSSGDSEEIPFN